MGSGCARCARILYRRLSGHAACRTCETSQQVVVTSITSGMPSCRNAYWLISIRDLHDLDSSQCRMRRMSRMRIVPPGVTSCVMSHSHASKVLVQQRRINSKTSAHGMIHQLCSSNHSSHHVAHPSSVAGSMLHCGCHSQPLPARYADDALDVHDRGGLSFAAADMHVLRL